MIHSKRNLKGLAYVIAMTCSLISFMAFAQTENEIHSDPNRLKQLAAESQPQLDFANIPSRNMGTHDNAVQSRWRRCDLSDQRSATLHITTVEGYLIRAELRKGISVDQALRATPDSMGVNKTAIAKNKRKQNRRDPVQNQTETESTLLTVVPYARQERSIASTDSSGDSLECMINFQKFSGTLSSECSSLDCEDVKIDLSPVDRNAGKTIAYLTHDQSPEVQKLFRESQGAIGFKIKKVHVTYTVPRTLQAPRASQFPAEKYQVGLRGRTQAGL